MNRRQFITRALLGSGIAAGAATLWLTTARDAPHQNVTALIKQLNTLDVTRMRAAGAWNLGQIFTHCTQSVLFSLHGFPQHKPDWFKHTAGSLAFSVFAARGAMHHDLSEPIPGAAPLPANAEPQAALRALIAALHTFDAHTGTLAPHFAFGALSKEEYAQAHVMHVYNHLEEITQV